MNRNLPYGKLFYFILALLLTLVGTPLMTSTACAQTVLSRTRIGGYSEDITYVNSGALKDQLVFLDGYELYAVPDAKKKSTDPVVRIADLRGIGIGVFPNGLTYVESEGLITINDSSQPAKEFLVDAQGQLRGTRTIKYLNGYVPGHLEGMTYIPTSSPSFPNHIIQATWDSIAGGPSRLEVIRLDGQVVAEIMPNWPAAYQLEAIGDVAFLEPNRLLVTFYDESVWTIDFNGNVITGPQYFPGTIGFEGIVQMKDGRIVGVGYPQNFLFFDSNLNRLPDSDRHDIFGLNLNGPQGVAWNTDTNEHLIVHDVSGLGASGIISAVPTSLNSATQIANPGALGFTVPRKATYLPSEHLIAVVHANAPRAILLFKTDGTLDSQINLTSLGLGAPTSIAFIPSTNQFAVRFNRPVDPAEARRLRILSRTGTLDRTIDMTCTGTQSISGVAFFNPSHPSGGQFIFIATSNRIVVTDFNGNLVREFNAFVKLGLLTPNDLSAITTGTQAGAFAITDGSAGELVVFTLD
ncbi:MAG TPA: hypothetical protein VGC66_09385 [Pyrinomonadaceae bacterium]|jgi:hypothetical protein